MAGVKRKIDDYQSKHGSFDEENIPDGTIALGNDVFTTCTIFRNNKLLHIRKYKKHQNRFYPSTEGITLSPFQFKTLVSSYILQSRILEEAEDTYDYIMGLPAKQNPVIIYSSSSAGVKDDIKDDEVNITFLCDTTVKLQRDFTCRSGRTYSKSIILGSQQYEELFAQKNSIISALCDLKYQGTNFKQLFELITGQPAPATSPPDDNNIVRDTLDYMVRSELYSALAAKDGLYNPLEVDPENLSKNRVCVFNEAVTRLCLIDVVRNFFKSVLSYPPVPLVADGMSKFVSANFLESINVTEIIKEARNAFCIDGI